MGETSSGELLLDETNDRVADKLEIDETLDQSGKLRPFLLERVNRFIDVINISLEIPIGHIEPLESNGEVVFDTELMYALIELYDRANQSRKRSKAASTALNVKRILMFLQGFNREQIDEVTFASSSTVAIASCARIIARGWLASGENDEAEPIEKRPKARKSLGTRALGLTSTPRSAADTSSANPVPNNALLPTIFSGTREELAWQSLALCVQTDPEAFFPEKGGSTREAKRVCLSCDVRTQCLKYALDHDERFGIWGGLSERERRRLKKVAV